MPKKTRSSSLENIYVSEAHRAIYSEISYLKRRIHLVEGERKANYESNEEELKRNETVLKDVRLKNSKLKKEHKEMLKGSDNYFEMVSKCFGDAKQAYTFRGKTLEQTTDILECKIGDLKNKLNLLQFQRKEVKEKLDSILKEERNLKFTIRRKNRTMNPRIKQLRDTDNNIALMQMKITEAENIQSKYKNMIQALKQENYMKENQINDMESVIQYQQKEVVKIRSVLADALKARKVARTHQNEVEENTLKEYTEREDKLFESRVQLKEIREKMDGIGTKLTYPKFHMIHRDSSLAEGLYVGGDPSGTQKAKSTSSIETVYNTLMEMTGESDPAAIVIRFQQQRNHAKELDEDEKNVKSEVRKCKLRKRFLLDKLNRLQFSGGVKREQLDKKIEIIDSRIDKVKQERNEDEKQIKNFSEIMDELLKKLLTICANNEHKVPALSPVPGAGGVIVGNKILNILNSLLTKMEQIMYEHENVFHSPMLSPLERDLISENESMFSGSQPLSFRYGSMTALNVIEDSGRISSLDILNQDMDRLSIAQKSMSPSVQGDRREDSGKGKLVDKKMDSSEEEEAAGRNLIKRQSQVLVEAKTRKGRFNPSVTIMPIKNKRP